MLASCAFSSLISLGSEGFASAAPLSGFAGFAALAPAERGPHRHRLLEHGQVLARLLLVGLEGRRRIGEGVGELRAEVLLLLDQRSRG